MKIIYGTILCLSIGAAAKLLSALLPVGAVAIAIVLGIATGNIAKPGERFTKGISFSEKHILALAIALMGVKLDYAILKQLGYRSLLLIVTAIGLTILLAVLLGRMTRSKSKLALLIGVGNGICGNSAIAAAGSVIGADEEDMGLSVAVINFLGTIGMFLLPAVATMLFRFSELNSGLLIGNTLQAVGQVTAGGFSVSETAGQTAMIVKMGRILMLTPVVLILIPVFAKDVSGGKRKKTPRIPLFIIGFIGFSLLASFKLLPGPMISILGTVSSYALIIAMAGVGLRITFASILRDGRSALLIGGLVFLLQIVFSCTVIYFLF